MTDAGGWDPTGEAERRLLAAVRDYGDVACLSDPRWLADYFADMLKGAPREADLLVAAADFGVARILTDHLAAGMDPDTAVRLTAANLAANRAYDAGACSWVTARFAQALGYQLAGQPHLPPVVVSEPVVAAPMVVTDPPRHLDGGATMTTPGPGPTPQPPPPDPETKRRPRAAVGFGAAALVVVYLVAAVVLKLPPLGHHPSPTPATTTSATTTSSTTTPPPTEPSTTTPSTTTPPTTTPVAFARFLPLTTLIPDQPAIDVGNCNALTDNDFTGVYRGRGCSVPGHTQWALDSFQFATAATYAADLRFKNRELDVTATPTSGCPPSGADQGESAWNSGDWPHVAGQIVECVPDDFGGLFSIEPTFLWTLPTQNTFFVLFTSVGTTWAELQAWWHADGGPG